MGSAWWQCTACLRTQEEDVCELQLNHCNLYDVPPDVFIYERTLEKLFLDANRIKDLPRPLFQCHELRVLSLSDNEVGTLPPAIASLINLEHLDLSKNTIKELPDSIKECKNLRSIDISVNPFERFPDSITHIVGLRELYLNDAYIEYLPANFGRLSSLKTLELRENNMMTLPKSMSRLVNLQRLDIGNNDFTELPEVVGDLISLTELWIDGNDIRRIPTNIDQLVRLNHFDCTMNAVHLIPSEIQGWRDISIMNLSSNEIYQLPDTLCYLQTVVTLKIDDNQLNSLPDQIGQMFSLEELIVTKNFLKYLPPSIGLLRKLHCLNADNNYLRSLPAEIGSCTALSLLSLRSNNLSRIPPELGHLSSLRVLNLVNNCIKFLPVSMLNLNSLKALWLSDNQSQPLVPLQQEFNNEEDIMVLSCFMLPQKPRQDIEQMEQPVGPLIGTVPGTGRRICFAAEVESEGPRQLHRAPTPYPKELRNLARHARNLHNQSGYNQQNNSETAETTIREAVVTKSTASLSIFSNSGTPVKKIPFGKNSSSRCCVNEELCNVVEGGNVYVYKSANESFDDVNNGTVLAEEKIPPDIREAKCVRNPSSEYIKQPTVADYVNSTWKPDEYSKANTAKIIESDKFAEPYRSTPINGDKGINHFGIDGFKVSDVPPLPPPYHIAAAFSKKAMLFQQINNAKTTTTTEPQILVSSSNLSSLNSLKYENPLKINPNSSLIKGGIPIGCSKEENLRLNNIERNDENLVNPIDEKSKSHFMKERRRRKRGEKEEEEEEEEEKEKGGEFDVPVVVVPAADDKIDEDDILKITTSLVFDEDQLSRPSKIPIYNKKKILSVDDDDKNEDSNDNSKSLAISSTPMSPITGKKYRLPLNTTPTSPRSKLTGAKMKGNSIKRIDNNGSSDIVDEKFHNENIKKNNSSNRDYFIEDNNPGRDDNNINISNKIIINGEFNSTLSSSSSSSFNNDNIKINMIKKDDNDDDDSLVCNIVDDNKEGDDLSVRKRINNQDNDDDNNFINDINKPNVSNVNEKFDNHCYDVNDGNDVDDDGDNNINKLTSINSKSKIPMAMKSPVNDRKPRLKWMFGPHRNANVGGLAVPSQPEVSFVDDIAYFMMRFLPHHKVCNIVDETNSWLGRFPVQVQKNPGLGFSIAGGIAGAETGIIVTKVNPDGPAQGILRPGDKILEVDGVDFTKMDHDRAVSVLRATMPIVSMMISRHQ